MERITDSFRDIFTNSARPDEGVFTCDTMVVQALASCSNTINSMQRNSSQIPMVPAVIPSRNKDASSPSTLSLEGIERQFPTSIKNGQESENSSVMNGAIMKFSIDTIGQNLSSSDMKKAEVDYGEIRKNDIWLGEVEQEFIDFIYNFIGCQAINNGSFGLKLNHDTSDLDLAIGVPSEDLTRVIEQLNSVGKFISVRESTADSVRHVFEFERLGVTIDLGVLTLRDYHLTADGMDKCREGMTDNDRITHTFMKKKLLSEGRIEEYKCYKLLLYKTFFSNKFNFVPIH